MIHSRHGRRAFLGGLLAMPVLAGCAPRGSADGAITIAVPTLPFAMGDPFMGLQLPSTLALHAIFDTLTLLGSDGRAMPAVASAWRELTPTRWQFDLRPGIRFANGRPLDAPAVVDIIALLEEPHGKRSSVGSDLKRIRAARAVTPLRVEFELESPMPLLPAALSVLRLPEPQAFADLGAQNFALNPVGSGPFQVEEWEGGQVRLAARPDAWRQPRCDNLALRLTTDQTARMQAVLSQTAQVATDVSPDDRGTLEAAGGRLVARATTTILVLNFITTKPGPLQDVRVRKAINLAIDREKLIAAFLPGYTQPVEQLAALDAFGRASGLAPLAFDPQQARRLLDAAGFGKGLDLTLAAVVGSAANDSAIFQQIALELAQVGISLRIHRLPPALLRQHLYYGDWPGDMFALRTGGFDALRSFRFVSCDWISPWRCDPALDELVDFAQTATTRAAAESRTAEVVAAERETFGALYLWQEPAFDAIGASVAGWRPTRATIALEDLHWL
jgi:peptide/nickel transport system substrate-binding protein